MPTKGYKTEYIILTLLGVLTVTVIFYLVVSGWMEQDPANRAWLRTTRSANVDGALVFYTLLERLGVDVSRSDRMFSDEELAERDVIFLLDPIVPIYKGESEYLRTWIRGGGVLVTTDIPPGLGIEPDIAQTGVRRSCRACVRMPGVGGSSYPLPQDVSGENSGFALERDVEYVSFAGECVFDINEVDLDERNDDVAILFKDGEGVRIIEHDMGAGRLVCLSDSSFLANGLIGLGDNCILAANLGWHALSISRGSNIVFNEYHQGYGNSQRGFAIMGRLLFTSASGWAVLTLTVGAILFMIYKGRRLAPRYTLVSAKRRSKLEYVHSVGSTYRNAGAHGSVLAIILSWFRRRLATKVGMPADTPDSALTARLARLTEGDQAEYDETLRMCEQLTGKGKISERQLTSATRRLEAMEMEVFNGRGIRKERGQRGSQ